jgi:hypothetical protein
MPFELGKIIKFCKDATFVVLLMVIAFCDFLVVIIAGIRYPAILSDGRGREQWAHH